MKKMTAAILTLAMMLTMTACSTGTATDSTAESQADSQAEDTTAAADESSADSETEAPTEETTEATTESPIPEVPDGYERVTFTNEKFGVNISFAVKTGADGKQGEDKYTSYEDEKHDGWILTYELMNVSPASFDEEKFKEDQQENGSVDGCLYDNAYTFQQDTWRGLVFYCDDYLDGRMKAEITFNSFQGKLAEDEYKEAIEVAAKTLYVEETGTNQLYTADGKLQSAASYVTIDPEITIDGQKVSTAFQAVAGYPNTVAAFTASDGSEVSIREGGGWGGKLYSSRSEDDDYRKLEIGGYPALCNAYNLAGAIEAHYIILLGTEEDGDEENFEVYVNVKGDFESSLVKDILEGVSDSDLLDRMDQYMNDYMTGVTYTSSAAASEEAADETAAEDSAAEDSAADDAAADSTAEESAAE